MNRPGEMKCRVCGWWPPLVRERKSGTLVRASESWRWRELRRHILEVASDECERGPHEALVVEMDR